MQKKFEEFLKSSWGLEIWPACNALRSNAGRLDCKTIFRSKKSGVQGLLTFIQKRDRFRGGRASANLVVFDKIVGRGAALLAVYLKAKVVYGALGSKLAAKTLREYKIKFHFGKTVPHILNRGQTGLCPIEKLSLSKTPEEFCKIFWKQP